MLTAKSLLACVFFPAWAWIRRPQLRFVFSTYRADLTVRDAVKCRRLIESDWYQTRWGSQFQLRVDQNQKTRYENNRTESNGQQNVAHDFGLPAALGQQVIATGSCYQIYLQRSM